MDNQSDHQVVIVGYGGMGSYHAKLIEAADHLQVAGTYDIAEYRQELSRSHGYRTYHSMDEVLRDEQIDVVLIATPNDIHKQLAIEALQAGKHVICEKPVTIHSADLLDIIRTAEKTGNVFMVHQNRRWDEDFLIVRELMRKQTIGDVFHIESRVQGANGIPGDWRQLKAYGGGMLLDWGVHLLDQLLLLTDSKIESVSAHLSTILDTEVDDGFTAFIRFKDGLTALVEVGTTNYIKLPRWYVKGSEGTAVIRDWDLSGEIVRSNPDAAHVEPKPIQAGRGLTKTMAPPSEESTIRSPIEHIQDIPEEFFHNFVAVIEGKAQPTVNNHQVLRVLQLIEMLFEAAEQNQIVQREL